jgi:hypothetical protein
MLARRCTIAGVLMKLKAMLLRVAGAFKQLVGAHAPNIFKFMDFC